MAIQKTRRSFLKQAGLSAAAITALDLNPPVEAQASQPTPHFSAAPKAGRLKFPREFTGANLSRIAFPIGGIGTDGVEVGGRGDLRLWQICNRPESGDDLRFVFPAIHVAGGGKTFTAVLERRLFPPFDEDDYRSGAHKVPGLPRLHEAIFRSSATGQWESPQHA